MFDNFINKILNQANTFSESIRNKTGKLTDNFDALKNKINTKSPKGDYRSVLQNDDELYLSPRAYSSLDNKWPTIINENMEWVPYVPSGDDNSIIERFIRVITINDDNDVR